MLKGKHTLKSQNNKPKRKSEESINQAMFITWLGLSFPRIRELTFAIPNGGSRNVVEAVNLKRQGLSRGVPDIYISIPNKHHHGFYMEFKVRGRKCTPEQLLFMARAREEGYLAEICYDFEEAKELFLDYISIENRR